MQRRDVIAAVTAVATGNGLSGCLDGELAPGEPQPSGPEPPPASTVIPGFESTWPEHARWLYDPATVPGEERDEMYGYIDAHPVDAPEGSTWRRPYETFGIEANLKHYRSDYGGRGMAENPDTTAIDVTSYASGSELRDADPEEQLEDPTLTPAFRLARPASTGGPLEEQEVVDDVGGFDIYERGAALNEDWGVLLSGLRSYVRERIAPVLAATGSGSEEPFVPPEFEMLWEMMDRGQYNEFALNPGKIPNNIGDDMAAFGLTNQIRDDGSVDVTFVEIYDDAEAAHVRDSFYRSRTDTAEKRGRIVRYRGESEEVVKSYPDAGSY